MIGVFCDDVKTSFPCGMSQKLERVLSADDHPVSGAAVQVQSSYSEYGKQEALSLSLSLSLSSRIIWQWTATATGLGRSIEPPPLLPPSRLTLPPPFSTSNGRNWNCNSQRFHLNFGKAARVKIYPLRPSLSFQSRRSDSV